MSITMLAHANFPFPPGAQLPLPVDPAPVDYLQIDPALLAISTNPSPSKPEKVKRIRTTGGRKRRKVEDDENGGEKPVKVKKPRKRPVKIPQPDGANATEGFIAYHPFATANTLGRYTKLSCENCRARKTKCSRHLKCLSCVARNEECVWADGPPVQESVKDIFGSTEDENRRLSRLVTILSARYSAREAVLAASEQRPPRPPPTLDDIPSRVPKREVSPTPAQQQQEDLPVAFQDYSDYLNRFENAGSSALDDARALLALAAPSGSATPQPDVVGTSEGEGVGLDVSAAAVLAVAQAGEEPFPFALPVPTGATAPASRGASRPKQPKASRTPAHPRVPPTQPSRSGSDSLDKVLQTALEAYVSLNGDAGLDDLLAQDGDGSDAVDAMTLLENTAFEPFAEGAQQFFSTNFDAYSTLPFYQLPLPVPPTAYRMPGSANPAQRPALAPTGRSYSPPRKSQREIASFLSAGAAAFREKDAPLRELPKSDLFEEDAAGERTDAHGLPVNEEREAAANGPVYGTAAPMASPMRRDRGDPMLLAPIRTNSASTISTVPPIRRSSWLVSPITSTFAPLRPILSIDAAGAFAKSKRDGTLGISRPGSGIPSASAVGGISALFRRSSINIYGGLLSATTPARSAVDETGLRPIGSATRLWREDEAGDSTTAAAAAARDSAARCASPDDMLDERFEPRAEGGGAFDEAENAFGGLQGEWAPFLPRLANEVERTDLTLVEEPEEIEADSMSVGAVTDGLQQKEQQTKQD